MQLNLFRMTTIVKENLGVKWLFLLFCGAVYMEGGWPVFRASPPNGLP